jgi:uncharacterized protein YndB with AHSA1/START domain
MLWNALTDIEEMKIWFFEDLTDFKLELGFKTEFEVKPEERTFTHIWEVVDIVNQDSYSISWTYKELLTSYFSLLRDFS